MATITGTGGNDTLNDNPGDADTLSGLAGDDVIALVRDDLPGTQVTFGGVRDTVDGGAGRDTLRFTMAYDEDELRLTTNAAGTYSGRVDLYGTMPGTGTVGGGGAGTPSYSDATTFQGIERFDVTLIEGSVDQSGGGSLFTVTLGDGADRLTSEVAQAIIDTGAGDDTAGFTRRLRFNSDALRVNADLGAGNDTLAFDTRRDGLLRVTPVTSTIGGNLTDGYTGHYDWVDGRVAFSGVENFTIEGSNGADTIVTGDGDDTISTLAGDDRVTAGAGVNILDGGADFDLLNVDLSSQASGVTIDLSRIGAQQSGGAGSITGFEGFFGTIVGSAFGDTLIEGADANGTVFDTRDGDDLVRVSRGNDSIAMGAGNDRLVLDFGTATASVSTLSTLRGSFSEGYSGGYYITDNSARSSFTGVENFTILTGSGADGFATGDGDDIVSTGAGNDTIAVGGGANVVDGGAGTDALGIDLSAQGQGIVINLKRAGAQQTGGTGSVLGFESFAGQVTGSAFDDTLIEGAFAFDARFDTGAGNDSVQVSRGNDTADLGDGSDRLVLDHAAATASVQVLAALSGTLAAGYSGGFYVIDNSARTSFSGVESFTIASGSFADSFATGDGNDVIRSGAGDDVVAVGAGANTVDGGAGIDALGISLATQTRGVTIDLTRAGAQQSGGSGSVTGFESFAGQVVGSAFADTLIEGAHAFNARFDTGAGNDSVQVSRGNDSVDMGGGVDRLILDYSSATAQVAMLTGRTGTLAGGYSGGLYIVDNSARTSFSGVEAFTILTGSGNDDFVTGDGDDIVRTGTGNDAVAVGAGTNVVDGGAGIDALGIDLSTQTRGVTIDLTRTGAQQTGGAGSVTGFETFVGTVTGSAFADVLIEGAYGFGTTFDTGAGGDTVQVSRGNDTANLGAGTDRLVVDYTTAAAAVQVLATLTGTRAGGYAGGFYIVDNAARTSFTGVEDFTVLTGAFADSFATGDGDDIVRTGAGNDAVLVGAGTNVVDGGDGIDALGIDLSGQNEGVTINFGVQEDQQTGGTGSVDRFETFGGTVTGSAFDDVLIEGYFSANAVINAGRGADLVQVSLGSDTVNMGDGSDTLIVDYSGATSAVAVLATLSGSLATGYGGGFYVTDNSARTSFTGVEDFSIRGGSANDTVITGDGADTLYGGAGDDRLTAGGGDDVLDGDIGTNILDGGAGVDHARYASSDAAVTVSLAIAGAQVTGQGTDTLIGIENVAGSDHDDVLTGNAGVNELRGNAGDDTLDGGTGADVLYGSEGDDLFLVDISGDRTIEYADEGRDTVRAAISWTLDAHIEVLELTGGALVGNGNALDNRITGTGGANVLRGAAGADTLIGADGNDTLDGGTGTDRLEGGAGDDGYVVDTAGDAVIETAGAGTDTVRAGIDHTLAANVENLMLTGGARSGTGNALANRIEGGTGDDVLSGLAGTDTLIGGAGADRLDGGSGADRMAGGTGDDTYLVDTAGDVTSEGSADGYDTVFAALSWTLATNVEALTLTGDAAVNGTGNTGRNRMIGNEAANVLRGNGGGDALIGGGGNDTLDGGTGGDRMDGGAGDDIYYVDHADDLVTEAVGAGIDLVRAAIDYTLGANVEDLLLTGAARTGTGNALANRIEGTGTGDLLYGLDGNDTLVGGKGNDSLFGGDGDDILAGGVATDRMTGGAGADMFRFVAGDYADTAAKADVILDFSQIEGDRIALSPIDAVPATAGRDAFRFVGTAAFGGTAGELRYEYDGRNTLVQADRDGDGAADLVIRLVGAYTLTVDDFTGAISAPPGQMPAVQTFDIV